MTVSVGKILASVFVMGVTLNAASIGPRLLQNGMKPKPQASAGRPVRSDLYTVALVPIPGAVESVATDVNDRGVVIGHYLVPQPDSSVREFSFVWDGKTLQTISNPGFPYTAMTSISNSGVLFGSWGNDGQVIAGFYDSKRNQWQGLPLFMGLPLNFGVDANESGVAVGYSCSYEFNCTSWLWNGKAYETLSLPVAPVAIPTSINDRGQIIGFAGTPPTDFSAFLLDRGVLSWIAPSGITATEVIPRTILNSGAIVLHGETSPVEFWKAFLLDHGSLKPLPEYGQPGQTTYNAGNQRGDLVGAFYSLVDNRLYAITAFRK
jgi:uncharacterized membrane protein